jgi:hypothetical protein
MTTGCQRELLLAEFADNDSQAITAASMRMFVNCIYDNAIDRSLIQDNLVTADPYVPLSANQGVVIRNNLIQIQNTLNDLDLQKADRDTVYTKEEINNGFFNKNEIQDNYYSKVEVYSKQEIDSLLNHLEQMIIDVNKRIDNIVDKNDLVE